MAFAVCDIAVLAFPRAVGAKMSQNALSWSLSLRIPLGSWKGDGRLVI